MPGAARVALPSSLPGNYSQLLSIKHPDFELRALSPLFCAFLSKMHPKVSEIPKRAQKGIMLSVKLDVIKCLDHGE